ncbi:MAG: DEAD/DEAH box helicase [Eubacterium sp.]|nr:DEAD/DEAH box helicase [Eubacterium sp.]
MFNPAKASANIKDEFIDYISTTHAFSNPALQRQFVTELKSNIAKGPLLEIKDIFKSGKSIEEMIVDEQCPLSPLFRDLEAIKPNDKLHKHRLPIDRKLYLHQEKAIRAIVGGHNAVVSTGTGSGKTNCFLIPVLNELLREKEDGTLGKGVRALFIYPMNALANDQMKNIREILMCYPDITFGAYNGGTENDEESAIAVYEAMFAKEKIPELRHRLPNEILSREDMKKNPPNILFTNYAMLEHLLLRPKDDVLFSNADFRFVVLDEAHIYTGATGIETSILLRRLRARISATKETRFILTSATLGSDSSVDDDIITFAQNLCGVNFDKEYIIRAEREPYIPNSVVNEYPNELYLKLADEENVVWDVLKEYGINTDKEKDEKELLYDFLITSSLYHSLRLRFGGICDLSEIGEKLAVDINVAIAFISLCTRAQKNKKSLIDARYHFFIRSLEGCYITIGRENKLFLNRQRSYFSNGNTYAVFEAAVCDDCGRIALVGRIENRKLVQASKLEEAVEYYYLDVDDNNDIEDDDSEAENEKKEVFYLCPLCGAIVSENEIHNLPCDCGKENYIKVIKAKILKSGARCGNCHTGAYKRLYLGNDAATAVLATSLYEELPELEYIENEEQSKAKNIFSRAASNNKKIPRKTGRQFLAFSDSRQEAAKFACYLGKSYNEFLRRRGICHIIKERKDEMISHEHTISDFVTLLTNYFTSKKSFAKSNSDESNLTLDSRQNAWVALLNELARYSSSTSLTSLGQIQFEYRGNTPEIIESIAEEYHADPIAVKALLDLLAFEIVKMGAIYPDSDSDIDDNDREYIFFTPSQRFVTYMQSPDKKRTTVSNWMPKSKGEGKGFYKSNRLYYVCKTLNISEEQAVDFLTQYFEYLSKPELGNPYCMDDINKNGTYVLRAKNFVVKINGSPNALWYQCKKCGKITQFNLGHCPSVRCEGTLAEINPDDISRDNHFAKLYMSSRMSPLLIKEHTAQLSKKESAEYQEQFIKKEINALSCSTTFEMGVDVGDLETVFLRDVPPLPSNYAQRAGRAGRSLDAAAFVLTFAKLSSHDLSFFNEPKKMIGGTILPPLFKVDNEKIVRRHVYAVALSMFFADHEDQYNHNDADKFINQKGYVDFIEWIKRYPDRLRDMLKRSIPDIDNLHQRLGLNDFSWIEEFSGDEGVFTQLIKEYESNIGNFEKLIKQFKKENDLTKAAICERKLQHYKKNKLIDFLARGNILPRYGFPVNTVELQQNTTANNVSKLRLSRDLQIAIAEYAPSSEVVADGRLYTSRYIKKTATGKDKQDWHTGYIGVCRNPECNTVNYSITPITNDGINCSSCGRKLTKMDFYESIEPRSGFVAERQDKDVPMTRQEKNYRSEDYYIGNVSAKTIDKHKYLFNSIEVQVESTTNDSLMVKSVNSFYVCPLCGYAVAEDENIREKEIEKQMRAGALKVTTTKAHESLYGQYNCNCKELVRRSLHHEFKTDVAKISFKCNTSDYNTMVSVMYAILNAMAKDLNIERRDIKACLSAHIIGRTLDLSIIIYDSVPGGAGHSRRLVTQDGRMLHNIFMSALKSMKTCNCDPSCYNCLRSYENQKIHDLLDRQLAIEFLQQFVGNVELVDESEDSDVVF